MTSQDDDDELDDEPLTPLAAREALEEAICAWIEYDLLPLMAERPEDAGELVHLAALDIAAQEWDEHEDVAASPPFLAIFGEAEDLLRVGDVAEAARRLRLLAFPKWPSTPHCVAAYAAHRGVVYGPHPFVPPVPPVVRDLFGDFLP